MTAEYVHTGPVPNGTVIHPSTYQLVLLVDRDGFMSIHTPLDRAELAAQLQSARDAVITDTPIRSTR